jgi:hypothetical protein
MERQFFKAWYALMPHQPLHLYLLDRPAGCNCHRSLTDHANADYFYWLARQNERSSLGATRLLHSLDIAHLGLIPGNWKTLKTCVASTSRHKPHTPCIDFLHNGWTHILDLEEWMITTMELMPLLIPMQQRNSPTTTDCSDSSSLPSQLLPLNPPRHLLALTYPLLHQSRWWKALLCSHWTVFSYLGRQLRHIPIP